MPIDPDNPASKKRKRWPVVKLPDNLGIIDTPVYRPTSASGLDDTMLSFGRQHSGEQVSQKRSGLSPAKQGGEGHEQPSLPRRGGKAEPEEEEKVRSEASNSVRAEAMGPPSEATRGTKAQTP